MFCSRREKSGRRRMTEKEEEDVIMKNEESSQQNLVRLDAQPPNIVNGTMKPYQIAGLNWLV